MAKKVTLTHIAEQLNLSVAAVSRALKDYDDIPLETKRKIIQTARKLGYKAPSRHKTIILTSPFQRAFQELGEPPSYFFASGVHHGLRKHNYRILVVSDDDVDIYLQNLQIDAFLFTEVKPDDARLLYCAEHNIPFVSLGRMRNEKDSHWVDINNTDWVKQTIMDAANLGKTDPLLIVSFHNLTCTYERIAAIKDAMEQLYLPFDLKRNVFAWEDYRSTKELEQYLTWRNKQPDAILSDSEIALLTYHQSLDHNAPTPYYCCLTSTVDLGLSLVNMDMQLYWQDFYAAGKQAAKIMIDLLEDPTLPLQQILLNPVKL